MFAALLLVACSETTTDSGMPMMTDASDAGPTVFPDAEVTRSLCPQGDNTMCGGNVTCCTDSTDCEDDQTPQSNCSGCLPFNHSLCVFGGCQTPSRLEGTDPINFIFNLRGSLSVDVKTFAGAAINAETAGGMVLTCDDIYGGADLSEQCYNIVQTRGAAIARGDDTFIMTFTRFAAGPKLLFVVYGYAEEDSSMQTKPIGVSCGSSDRPMSGAGLTRVAGDTMRLIQ